MRIEFRPWMLAMLASASTASSPTQEPLTYLRVYTDLPFGVQDPERRDLAERIAPELLAAFYSGADHLLQPEGEGVWLGFRAGPREAMARIREIPGYTRAELVRPRHRQVVEDWGVRLPQRDTSLVRPSFVAPGGLAVVRTTEDGTYLRVSARQDRDLAPTAGDRWGPIWDLAANPEVMYVEPNFGFGMTEWNGPDAPASNDKTWHLDHVGLKHDDRAECPVTVAVIDSGVQQDHPELAANIAPGGKNFWDKSSDVDDLNGHGTKVAGAIGARGLAGSGAKGLCWSVQLLPVKIFPGPKVLAPGDVVKDAVDHAVRQGAQILNCSFGGFGYHSGLEGAFQRAQEQGVLAVVAAGNTDAADTDIDHVPFYPPWFEVDNLVTVGAIVGGGFSANMLEGPWHKSHTGRVRVHLFAPGVEVWSTQRLSSHAFGSGTSLAAPLVAGAAARIWRAQGEDYQRVRDCLLGSVVARANLSDVCSTGGSLWVAGDCDPGPRIELPLEAELPIFRLMPPPFAFTREGRLEGGLFGAGGETTGTLLHTPDGDFELDLGWGQVPGLAVALEGRQVVVRGWLEVVDTPERGRRRVVHVGALRAREGR